MEKTKDKARACDRGRREGLVKKLFMLVVAIGIGLMLLISTLLADGAEALRALSNREEFVWDRHRQV